MKSLPKVSLRDLLWLIVVVVLSVLLWKQNKEISELHKQQDAARVEAEANRLLAEERQADLEAQIQRLIAQLKQSGRNERPRFRNCQPITVRLSCKATLTTQSSGA